jgi:hypothetical protein
MNNWLQKLEPYARYFMWIFGMILAIATVVSILDILTNISRLILLVSLILFFFAGLVVFISDIQQSRQRQGAEIPAHTEQPRRNRWILIGLLILVVIILVPIVARQLLPDSVEYQSFLTAFAATGAWVTGIAIAVFAYQQYKLRQTEHRLLFEPQLTLTSGDITSIITDVYPRQEKTPPPYQIKWTVFLQNSSEIPILTRHMEVEVKLVGENSGRQTHLTPLYCHLIEPAVISMPFEVNRNKPQRLVWLVEGRSAGDPFDYVSGDSDNRDFALVFRVFASMPHDPESMFSKETVSWGIYVPKDANW